MKIVEGIDDNLLKVISEKYNYDNIQDGDGPCRYYYIPPELVMYDYVTSFISVTKNPVNERDNWVRSTKMDNVLWEIYKFERDGEIIGLGKQEYFDLVVLHINDTDDRPICPQCGKELSFSNRINSGYSSSGHRWNTKQFVTCSLKCHNEFLHSNWEKYEKVAFQGFVQTECQRTKFLNKGSLTDVCYLYITKSNGNFKFGVTEDLLTRRFHGECLNQVYDCELRAVLIGPRDFIADFEANIKYELQDPYEWMPMSDAFKFAYAFGVVYENMRKWYPDYYKNLDKYNDYPRRG